MTGGRPSHSERSAATRPIERSPEAPNNPHHRKKNLFCLKSVRTKQRANPLANSLVANLKNIFCFFFAKMLHILLFIDNFAVG
jgi:hypothetical protein